jgi:hypothetical protein
MTVGTIVEYNGLRGVVVPDFGQCCCHAETPVVFDGHNEFKAVLTTELTEIGPENPAVDLCKCGAGKREKCCIFLVIDVTGPMCARHTNLRYLLIGKDMVAKRHPTQMYPQCQLQDTRDKKIVEPG